MCRLIRSQPTKVSHVPRALDYFLSKVRKDQKRLRKYIFYRFPMLVIIFTLQDNIIKDSIELPHILTWNRCSPIRALALMCPRTYPPHSLTLQFAVIVLSSYPPEAVLFYIPQVGSHIVILFLPLFQENLLYFSWCNLSVGTSLDMSKNLLNAAAKNRTWSATNSFGIWKQICSPMKTGKSRIQ